MTSNQYPIINISDYEMDKTEQSGTKYKFWCRNPQNQQWLFKEGRPSTGENWSEKIACELCTLLNIPHARYDFALWKNTQGVVSPKFVTDEERLILGNELLAKIENTYDETKFYKNRHYTLRVVLKLFSPHHFNAPLNIDNPHQLTAEDFFTGYLLLDALIGNTDRHHENFGVILHENGEVSLSPTYDHAACLGRNEPDNKRQNRMQTKDKGFNVEHYARNAKSSFYATQKSCKTMSTFDAFTLALKLNQKGGLFWLNALEKIDKQDFSVLFSRIPATLITEAAAEFAMRILQINQTRLLTLKEQLL